MLGKFAVLKKYFGFKPGQTALEFGAEVKELTEEDQLELATLAADALGIPVEERSFRQVTVGSC